MLESQPASPVPHAPDPDRHIVALIFKLSRHLATTLDRHMAPFNVTGQQAALLVRSCSVSDATPTQLAPWLGTDNAGITRLLDRLEAKGLVHRGTNPADRRAIVVELTPDGRALVPHLISAFHAVIDQLLGGLDADEIPELESLLRHLLDNVQLDASGDGHE